VAYSQKNKEHNFYSWDLVVFVMENFTEDFSNDTTFYIYMDSNIVKGLTVYTDSIKVDFSSKKDDYMYVRDYGSHNVKGSSFYKIYYPITLKDNPLFKKSVYYNDFELMSHIRYSLYYQRKKTEKNGYFILTSDGKYINYAFLEKKDGDLYTKYNPFNEDDSGTVMRVKIKGKKMKDWLTQKLEMNKNKIISVTQNGKVYIVKLFSN
jgi:hypothetical protein